MAEVSCVVRPRWGESDRFVPRKVVQPVQRFMAEEAAGGGIMLLAAVVALVWANSSWRGGYERLWETPVELRAGSLHLELTVREFINDVLMTPFFFLVALEIKRELVYGDLRDRKAAALPAIAALGGMIVPALVFTAVARGTDGSDGWGIPMATDIAFAVGIVTILGRRVSTAARTFLLTLAVVDDIGGILVIAVFYSRGLDFASLGCAAAAVGMTVVAARLHIRSYAVYLSLGALAWYALHNSGVHATIAGVALGFVTPAWSFSDPKFFPTFARPLVERVSAAFEDNELTVEESEGNEGPLRELVRLANETMSPVERHLASLGPWIAFLIVPVFALANAGVRVVGGGIGNPLTNRVLLAGALGLFVGKAVGIFCASVLAVRLGLGKLPNSSNWFQMVGLAVTGGVGFTVALFVTNLSFSRSDLVDSAKAGVLLGSLVSGIAGYLILRRASPLPEDVADSA